MALRRAARAVQSGDCTFAACIAGDTNHVDSFRRTLSTFSRFAQDAVYPYGSGGPNASFALIMAHYMAQDRRDARGLRQARRRADETTRLAFRMPCSRSRCRSKTICPRARSPIRSICSTASCLVPAPKRFVVMRDDIAEDLGLPYARILSTIERHNAFADDPIQWRGGWAVDLDELYAMAGLRPDDVDFVQTYDDYPVISMMQLEDLGLCEKGAAPAFVRANSFTIDGSCPHNTCGGQLSVGQAGCAGGYIGLVEAIRQLTGQAIGAPVADAQIGLVSGFGMITYDRGLASGAALLGRASS